MTLKSYNKKRDFKVTNEPKGKIHSKKSAKLLYIIQKHAASHLHYDFRLEMGGVLLSWAVPKGPCLDPTVKRLAMHVEDHPIEYGSFEGIIPKDQYGGGTVILWDKGEWISGDENPIASYKKGSMKFTLKGEKLNGEWKLIRINQDDKTWLLIKVKDEFSKNLKKFDVTLESPKSVLTNKTLEELTEGYKYVWGKQGLETKKTKNKKIAKVIPKSKINLKLPISVFPKEFSPQLATLVDKPPVGKNWIHEIKFDGYRIIAFKQNNETRLFSRNNKDWTSKFKNIKAAIDNIPIKNAIFDGEVVVLNEENKSDFRELQNSLKEGANSNFIYYIFDLIYYEKYNLTTLSLLERKKILQELLRNIDMPIYYSDHVFGTGQEIFEKSCGLGLEGIISKDGESEYIQKRSQNWVKSKCIKRQEFVIGGFTKPQGSRQGFGALLLGTYNKRGQLIYNGNVGTGFTQQSLKTLHKKLMQNMTDKNPFTIEPPKVKNITWVKPILVGEIEFIEWTNEGNLRHPSFKGLRSDKLARNIMTPAI
jgi:bifunctional non-homologous end joining protein LigD